MSILLILNKKKLICGVNCPTWMPHVKQKTLTYMPNGGEMATIPELGFLAALAYDTMEKRAPLNYYRRTCKGKWRTLLRVKQQHLAQISRRF
jgi:hypothetical protein